MNTTPKLLYLQIAEKIQDYIEQNSIVVLPSISKLSKQYGVSYSTMLKSVHYLRENNVLDFSQGRAMIVLRNGIRQERREIAPKEMNLSQKFYNKLKTEIKTGKRKVGEELPKVFYFAHTFNVSSGTVCNVLKILSHENIIHKNRKKWIVGPAPVQTKTSPFYDSNHINNNKIVIILAPDYDIIDSIYSVFLSPFIVELMGELKKKKIGIVMALWEQSDTLGDNIVSGRENIRQLIKQLGNRYCGAFSLSRANLLNEFRKWTMWMCQFKKPVLWIDEGANIVSYDRKNIPYKEFYKCVINEDEYTRVAVDVLQRSGHSNIAILNHDWPGKVREPWIDRRIQNMKDYAEQLNPSVKITVKDVLPDPWMKNWDYNLEKNDTLMLKFIQNIKRQLIQENPNVSSITIEQLLKSKLMDEVPSLAELLENKDITALIALDQSFAVNYYYWFTQIGINIPNKFSIISLGHNLRFNHHKISSVDPCFDNIGYVAAHIFIGDIPVYVNKNGIITAHPEYINRGSVGSPPNNSKLHTT